MLPKGRVNNLAAGEFQIDSMHGPQFDAINVLWQRGDTPTSDELLYMIQLSTDGGRESALNKYIQTLAVNTEDTEPEGEQVGFLRDPHKTLYPYLFPDGGETMPVKVRHLLKAHVLNQLEDVFDDPDNFIYFTVYGSGVAYNWDEGGDLDVQMWIDLDKFQSLNNDKAEWTMDDLLAEVRRNVQLVNFPTVKDIGLVLPNGYKDDVTPNGSMLVQYYPKPGKGTEEENLAQKPYSCLDLETGKWIVNPEPIAPTFYGLHFIDLMPKANDMALQAEALLNEYERNVLNWQFWFSLYSRYNNNEYQKQYQEAQRNAIMEKQGIKTMFEGIFGGRQEAYSPEGQGIEDERDMLQKLLEVWGIFQRLKHYARAKLPWDEQELPASSEDSKESSEETDDGSYKTTFEDSIHNPSVTVIGDWSKVTNQQVLDSNRGSDLRGLPGAINVPGHGRLQFGSHSGLQNIANQYAYDNGINYNPPREYAKVDPRRAKRIAEEYENAQHNPHDPAVQRSFEALKNETKAQYEALVRAGYTYEFYPEGQDPYPNSPREAVMDLHDNKHMYVYPTTAGYGSEGEDFNDPNIDEVPAHPLLEDTGLRWNGKPVLYNDLFRAVHDTFGHAKEGVGFRADGEENAWRQHAAMYSDVARPAMTSETRGQNSWVNFGPYAEQNQNAKQDETVYAPQKAALMPEWTHHEGDADHNWRTTAWRIESSIYEEELWTEPIVRESAWADVMAKAQRIRDAGGVQLQRNGQQHIVGTVASGTKQGVEYYPEIWRQSPDRNTISLWDCTCPWSGFSWGRTRQWKKYEGRPCAHTLALYWESLSNPLDDVEQDQQLQIPGLDPYANQPPPNPMHPPTPSPIDLNQALQQTVVPPTMPPAQMPQNTPIIQPTKPQTPDQMTITFPGAISSWRKKGALQNGDYARLNVTMTGFDDRGTQHTVPRNSIVEIIWSDAEETIAIYSLGSGPLGPHNARIVGPTSAFSWVPRTRGTAPKRH